MPSGRLVRRLFSFHFPVAGWLRELKKNPKRSHIWPTEIRIPASAKPPIPKLCTTPSPRARVRVHVVCHTGILKESLTVLPGAHARGIVTEGLLTQRLLNDPELSDVGLVIFDEFHERSLQCDLGFAMALDVRRALRPDLRLLVMSATLDTETIAAHLEDADVHTAEARMFPVETRYLQVPSAAPIWAQAAGAVHRALSETDEGDILCFLPGEGEIKRCAEELNGVPDVIPLYGALSKEEGSRRLAAAAWKTSHHSRHFDCRDVPYDSRSYGCCGLRPDAREPVLPVKRNEPS